MDAISMLPPTHPVAPRDASDATAGATGQAPVRPAADQGFPVKSLDRLLGVEPPSLDSVHLTSVEVQLDVDDSTNRVVATVFDRNTGEVLNQFPADAILENARGIRELLARELDVRV